MPSIDERVVSMAFENAKFEAGVAQTLATLSKLNDSIAKVGTVNGLSEIEKSASKVTLEAPMTAMDKLRAKFGLGVETKNITDIETAGEKVTLNGPQSALDKLKQKLGLGFDSKPITDLERASDKVTLSGVGNAVDGVSLKLGAMQVAAVAAFSTLVSKATTAAAGLGKSLSLGPITQGFQEYATNLNSIQTILANTEAQGSNLQDVNAALKQLNAYSDKTIYNFGEMAKNIGTFTAAGVDLDTSVQAIKGIANLAALSGSNSQQASTAMYQLSQAIAAGKVGLQDWNSVVNAGMGGAIFQKALATTALNMGKIADGAYKVDKATGKATINGESFRESIMAKPGQESWLTSEVLTSTLKQFTGDLSDAELAAQGFTQEQIMAIQKTAKTAQRAATEVKTISGVFDVVKESIGSGWAATFQTIFGNFEEAKKTFTDFTAWITGFTNGMADARNRVLSDWKELGGRDTLIKGLKSAFEALASVIVPIKDAFRDIFPAKTGEQLFELTTRFKDLMDSLKLGPEAADGLRRTFAGLFAILHIGWTIVKNAAGVIFDLLGVVGQGSGGILNFTGSIGDFLVSLDNAISKGGALKGVFAALTSVLRIPIDLVKSLASALFGMFDGVKGNQGAELSKTMADLGDRLKPIKPVVDAVTGAFDKFTEAIGKVKDAVAPVLTGALESVRDFLGQIVSAFVNADFDSVFAALETTFIGGIFLTLKKAIGGGIGLDVGGGMLENLSKLFNGLTGSLKAMQQNIQAGTLLKIAAAIGVLTVGVMLLSTIEPKKLTTAMTAVAVGMGELAAAMSILSKIGGPAAFATMPFIAASMIGLAAATVILAGAVKIFSTLSWDELAKGLVGVGGGLTAIAIALKFMGPSSLIQGPALIAIAIALNVLAAAVKQFAELSWGELAKGILSIGLSLTAMAAGLALLGPELIFVGPGLIAASIGMSMLAGAVGAFGSMKLDTLAKGILGVAAALVAIGLAITIIPPTIALQAAGLILLGVALTAISGAISILGSMKVGTLVKGIVAMGGALVVLGIGLTAMSAAGLGAVALIAAAGAFAILAPAIALMGNLDWSTIFKGLATMALTLGVLSVAGAIATVPLIALGGALAVLGLGLIAVVTPIYILAKALSLLGEEGTKGVAVMVAALTAFIAILPKIVIDFVKGLVEIADGIAKLAPKIITALGSILDTVIQFVKDKAPDFAVAVGTLISAFLTVLVDNAPKVVDAGFKLLTDLLSGIANNIGRVTAQVGDIVVKFLDKLKGDSPKITESGVGTMSAFLLGIANHFPALVNTVATMITKFIGAVSSKIPVIVGSAVNLITKFIATIVGMVPKVILAGVQIIASFLTGIGNAIPKIVGKALDVAERFVGGVARGTAKLVTIGFQAVIDFLNGTANAIRRRGPELRAAGWNVADALIDGMRAGIAELGQKVLDALGELVRLMPKKVRQLLGIASPSKVFAEIGRFTMAGFAVGIDDGTADVDTSMAKAARGVISTAKETLGRVPALLDGMMDMDPVIAPVLDLSIVEREAKKLADLTNVTPITAAASYGQASSIAQEQTAAQAADVAQAAQAGPSFNFEQNNYSPEALSDVEIYRQTRNQFAQIKSALDLVSA